MPKYTEENVLRYLYNDIYVGQEIPFNDDGYIEKGAGMGNIWEETDKYIMDIENYWRNAIRNKMSFSKFKSLMKIHIEKELKYHKNKSLEFYFTLYRRGKRSQPLLTSLYNKKAYYEDKKYCCF